MLQASTKGHSTPFFWILMVGNQTTNLIPNPSFGHNSISHFQMENANSLSTFTIWKLSNGILWFGQGLPPPLLGHSKTPNSQNGNSFQKSHECVFDSHNVSLLQVFDVVPNPFHIYFAPTLVVTIAQG